VDVLVWAPDGLDGPAPLVLVHDGPEYAEFGRFTDYLGAGIASGDLPPLRAALLGPGDRNDWYSANLAYARTIAEVVVPVLPPATVRIGVGVSLGALAMLHLHRSHPATLNGLLLQSGSFFTAAHDPQESAFGGFGAVTRFVTSVHDAADDEDPVPVTLTCGLPEENLANNRAMAATLERLGYRAVLREVRDSHNYTAWRDALHPGLTELVADVVGVRAT
jgi:enterochelin esterase family protein